MYYVLCTQAYLLWGNSPLSIMTQFPPFSLMDTVQHTHHVLHTVTYNQYILIISSAQRACSFTRSVQIRI